MGSIRLNHSHMSLTAEQERLCESYGQNNGKNFLFRIRTAPATNTSTGSA